MRDYKDHDRSRHSLMLFGYGDGGGGPNKNMLESLRRAKDLQGLPRTTMRSSDDFFTLLENDCTDRPLMIGELYFEYHRGTYTTQAANKRDNRKSEFLLHDVEFLSTIAEINRDGSYLFPKDELDRLWKLVLLNQFHDILPGSSITLVYEDSERHYDEIGHSGRSLRRRVAAHVLRGGDTQAVVNTIGFDRAEVATTENGSPVYVEAPSYGIGRLAESPDRVMVNETGNRIILENVHLPHHAFATAGNS